MTNEEFHLMIINDYVNKYHCSFFDAIIYYCDENTIDPEDIVQCLDEVALERLKQSAIDERLVRKNISKDRNIFSILE